MNAFRIVALVGLLVGCAAGGYRPKAPSPTARAAAAPAVVELGEVTLYEGDDAVMKIHADGSTEIGYRSGRLDVKPGVTASSKSLPLRLRPGPAIRTDGTFAWKGEDVIRVNADGTFTDVRANQPVPIVITGDTARRRDHDVGIELAADGSIRVFGGNPEALDKPLRVEGADTPGKRRAILAFAALQLMAVPAGTARVESGP